MATFLNGLQPTRKTTIQTGFMAIILNRLLDKEVKDRGLSLVSNLVFRLRLRTSANNWICRKLENNTEDRKKKRWTEIRQKKRQTRMLMAVKICPVINLHILVQGVFIKLYI